jgi:hypothetical protein
MSPNARKTAKLNIRHYRTLLNEGSDAVQRQMIIELIATNMELLAEEEAKPRDLPGQSQVKAESKSALRTPEIDARGLSVHGTLGQSHTARLLRG